MRSTVYRTPLWIVAIVHAARLLAHLTRFPFRHPVLVLAVIIAVLMWRVIGWPGLIVLAMSGTVGLAVRRRRFPASFSRFIGTPARGQAVNRQEHQVGWLCRYQTAALALLQGDRNLSGVEAAGAHVSSKPFRLDIAETGEQWVVTRTTPHGKAVSQIPAPFRREVLHGMLADIEKALIRPHSPVTTRHAASADSSSCEPRAGETIWANEVRR